jgi:hypothetical protein
LSVAFCYFAAGAVPIVRWAIQTDRYVKMWNVISECIQAEIARRTASPDWHFRELT